MSAARDTNRTNRDCVGKMDAALRTLECLRAGGGGYRSSLRSKISKKKKKKKIPFVGCVLATDEIAI